MNYELTYENNSCFIFYCFKNRKNEFFKITNTKLQFHTMQDDTWDY